MRKTSRIYQRIFFVCIFLFVSCDTNNHVNNKNTENDDIWVKESLTESMSKKSIVDLFDKIKDMQIYHTPYSNDVTFRGVYEHNNHLFITTFTFKARGDSAFFELKQIDFAHENRSSKHIYYFDTASPPQLLQDEVFEFINIMHTYADKNIYKFNQYCSQTGEGKIFFKGPITCRVFEHKNESLLIVIIEDSTKTILIETVDSHSGI